jgi:hypothetical protein
MSTVACAGTSSPSVSGAELGDARSVANPVHALLDQPEIRVVRFEGVDIDVFDERLPRPRFQRDAVSVWFESKMMCANEDRELLDGDR